MIRRLGVVPAAGKCKRFGGMRKELLPVEGAVSALRRCVCSMTYAGAELVLVIGNTENLADMAREVGDKPVVFALQRRQDCDVWGAIRESFRIPAERYFYGMPDTVYSKDAFRRLDEETVTPFGVGHFATALPERFGVLMEGGIVDKPVGLRTGQYQAWGVLTWTWEVVEYWQERAEEIESHTQAFNMAMRKFGWMGVELAEYEDLGTLGSYIQYLKGVQDG